MHWICIEKKKTANPHRHTGCPKKSQIRENDLKRKKSKGNIFEQNREFGKNRENEKRKRKKTR